jgi:hypothetical protein
MTPPVLDFDTGSSPSPTPSGDLTSPLFDSPWFWPVVIALFLALVALGFATTRHDD